MDVGSSRATTRKSSPQEILSSPDLLFMLPGRSARRRLEVISMENDELFTGYWSDLALRTRNARNLRCELALLDRFRGFLADRPSADSFLTMTFTLQTGLQTWV